MTRFWMLSTSFKIGLASWLPEGLREPFVDEVFKEIDELTGPQREAAIADLAAVMSASQIETLLTDLPGDISGLIEPLMERAAGLDNALLVARCLSLVSNKLTRGRLITQFAPGFTLDTVTAIMADEDNLYDQGAIGALALRATQLGDKQLAIDLLYRQGDSISSWDDTLEKVYALAPSSWADALIERTTGHASWPRAILLAQLASRVAAHKRKAIIEMIVKDAQGLYGALTDQRIEVFRKLQKELTRMPASMIVSIWREALRVSAERGREDVLVDVRAFAPLLIARFGDELALHLDEAIRLFGGDSWP